MLLPKNSQIHPTRNELLACFKDIARANYDLANVVVSDSSLSSLEKLTHLEDYLETELAQLRYISSLEPGTADVTYQQTHEEELKRVRDEQLTAPLTEVTTDFQNSLAQLS